MRCHVLLLHKNSTIWAHASSPEISCVYLLRSTMAHLFRNHKGVIALYTCTGLLIRISNKTTVLLSTFDISVYFFKTQPFQRSHIKW